MVTRIISAVVAALIGAGILCFAHTAVLPAAVAFLSVLGVFELYRANKLTEYKLMTALACTFTGIYPFLVVYTNVKIIQLFTTAVITGIFAAYLPLHNRMSFEKLSYAVLMPLLLGNSMSSLCRLELLSERHGVAFIVLSLCGAWAADTAAYFTGTFFGRHKLCPEISPKKTVEGFIGGIVFDGLFFVLFNSVYVYFFARDCGVNYFSSFILGMICAALGTVGDLSASLIKRQCGIKDYGKIMPGHGGFMDRFDSVLFVVPFMYAYLSAINIYV
ncbi:MAG: phosphatidate cytidylyltransferase [Oscillospiraceae bacterium]|nr:phosphatidate cytidylyltransferase [Oscillospiraceae bacterium]